MLSCLGKTLLLLSISGYAFLIKNSSLKKVEFTTNLENSLTGIEFTYKNEILENCFNFFCIITFLSCLSLFQKFSFSAFFGGISLFILNLFLNYDFQMHDLPSNIFVVFVFITLGMFMIAFPCPAKNK
jgi:hypothetical protein